MQFKEIIVDCQEGIGYNLIYNVKQMGGTEATSYFEDS